MKRIITFILVFMMTLILSACAFGQKVPKGYINAEEHFDTEGFQDYTDYCKYYYQDKSAVEKDARYSRVSKADIAAISNYFAHFRSSAATDVANAYDFNPDSISEGDYVLIFTENMTIIPCISLIQIPACCIISTAIFETPYRKHIF